MSNHSKNGRKKELKIQRIETTTDRLTGRAGLALFVACPHGIQVFGWIDRWFATLRKNRKGLGVSGLFEQALCVMVDGASRRS
jgi:hypothetical protein